MYTDVNETNFIVRFEGAGRLSPHRIVPAAHLGLLAAVEVAGEEGLEPGALRCESFHFGGKPFYAVCIYEY